MDGLICHEDEIRSTSVSIIPKATLSNFSFQPVLYNWCNKGHGMYYPKELLLLRKSRP